MDTRQQLIRDTPDEKKDINWLFKVRGELQSREKIRKAIEAKINFNPQDNFIVISQTKTETVVRLELWKDRVQIITLQTV